MKKLVLSGEVIRNIEDILTYTKTKWGKTQALEYHKEIKKCILTIAQNPAIGVTLENNLDLQYRFMICRQHKIIYRDAKKEVTILTILHSAMDIDSRIAKLVPKLGK